MTYEDEAFVELDFDELAKEAYTMKKPISKEASFNNFRLVDFSETKKAVERNAIPPRDKLLLEKGLK